MAFSLTTAQQQLRPRRNLPANLQIDWRELVRASSASARAKIPFEFARKSQVLPLGILHSSHGLEVLTVLVADPEDYELKQQLRFASGCDVILESAPAELLPPAIEAAYQTNEVALKRVLNRVQSAVAPSIKQTAQSKITANEPVPELVETLLKRAVSLAASDIHFEPYANFYRVRYRIHGRLTEDSQFKIHKHAAAHVLRRLKVLAELDTTGTARPLDGGFSFTQNGAELRARLSLLPQVGGEKAVIRLFDEDGAPERMNFANLGLRAEQESELIRFLEGDAGTLLLSGPTGSGKSTLLSAALHYLNDSEHQIISLENPVERMIPGITQVDLSTQSSSAADLLPFLLRQDPDVIMLGEIREQQTAQLALSAGLTGHLVLSTVHAGSALEILERLFEFGLSPRLLACSLRLLVSQRLVLKNCPYCTVEAPVSIQVQRLFGLKENFVGQSGQGCDHCRMLGGSGRIGVYEFLPVNEALRAALERRNVTARILREAAIAEGYVPYAVQVRHLLIEGVISSREALKTLGLSPTLFGI